MKVIYSCIVCVCYFVVCRGEVRPEVTRPKADSQDAEFQPYKLNNDYTVIDTGTYGNNGPIGDGLYAIIKRKGMRVDTIDLTFGIKDLGNGVYFYQTLTHVTDPEIVESKGTLCLDLQAYLVVSNKNKTNLSNLARHFDDYYSSPSVIDGKIYYWQLEKTDAQDTQKVFAAAYNPETKQTKSFFLINDAIETDDSNYFTAPFTKKDSVIFTIEGKKKWEFSKDFNAN